MLKRLLLIPLVALPLGVALLVYGTLSGGLLTWVPRLLDAPADPSRPPMVVEIPSGATAGEVADLLHQAGLIRSRLLFHLIVRSRGVEGRLTAGEYELSPAMTTGEIVDALVEGRVRRSPTVTIPEGWRAEQIADRLQSEGLVDREAFLEAVKAPPREGLLATLPPDASAEGYLFPNTYEVRRGATASDVVAMMVAEFERQFGETMRAAAQRQGLSVHEVVTLASIVEREAVVPAERPRIARVFLNRLQRGMPLQADPTVQFAVASEDPQAATYGYWKQDLSALDLGIPSPYNTYYVTGLPPGPICNPGRDSLAAVVFPEENDYLYFVARPDGSHVFARTLAEHEQNVREVRGR